LAALVADEGGGGDEHEHRKQEQARAQAGDLGDGSGGERSQDLPDRGDGESLPERIRNLRRRFRRG
jgi:hypothetical protein